MRWRWQSHAMEPPTDAMAVFRDYYQKGSQKIADLGNTGKPHLHFLNFGTVEKLPCNDSTNPKNPYPTLYIYSNSFSGDRCFENVFIILRLN